MSRTRCARGVLCSCVAFGSYPFSDPVDRAPRRAAAGRERNRALKRKTISNAARCGNAKSNGRASRTRTRKLCVHSSLLICFSLVSTQTTNSATFARGFSIHAHHGIHHTHTSYRGGDADNRHNVCPRPSVLYVLQLRSTSLTEQARPSASARTTYRARRPLVHSGPCRLPSKEQRYVVRTKCVYVKYVSGGGIRRQQPPPRGELSRRYQRQAGAG